MGQERKILIGGVALVLGRLKKDGSAMVEVCNELDPLLTSINFAEKAPFEYVSLIIRYGVKNDTKPKYQGIAKKYGELRVAIELDMDKLKSADKDETIKTVFEVATLDALIHVGEKYQLPVKKLVEKRQEVIANTGISF
jgi:hypothetical protein